MKLLISGRHVEITPALKEHAYKKASKVTEYFKPIERVHIILGVEKYRHTAEVLMTGKGIKVSSKVTTKDMYLSIDKSLLKIVHQIDGLKSKKNVHRAKLSRSLAAYGEVSALEPAVSVPQAVKVQALRCTTEEALVRFQRDSLNYFFFNNAETDTINLLVREEKGEIRIIEPKKS